MIKSDGRLCLALLQQFSHLQGTPENGAKTERIWYLMWKTADRKARFSFFSQEYSGSPLEVVHLFRALKIFKTVLSVATRDDNPV